MPKAPFVFDLACEWIESKDALRSRCGYGLIYELSKNARKKELTDEFFLNCIDHIRKHFDQEDTWGRMSMGGALIGIGKRNKTLNKAALILATQLGPIDINEGNSHFDPVKHLTNDSLKKSWDHDGLPDPAPLGFKIPGELNIPAAHLAKIGIF